MKRMMSVSASMLLICITIVIAACTPESNVPAAGINSILIRIDDGQKLIRPEGADGVTHYRYQVDNEVTSVDSGFIPKTGNDSFFISDVQKGEFTITAGAYIQQETPEGTDYVLLSEKTVTEILKEGESKVVSIVFDTISEELSGNISIKVMLPEALTVKSNGFSYTCTVFSASDPDIPVYSIGPVSVADGTYGKEYSLMLPGQKPGSYTMCIRLASSDSQASWIGYEAMRLFPVLEASGTIDMTEEQEAMYPPAIAIEGHGPYTAILTCSDPSADIFYTADGTDPFITGILYAGPFQMESLMPIRAYAASDDGRVSVESSFGINQPEQGHLFGNGGFIFYDRGPEYGIYTIQDDELIRLTDDEDWRYMVIAPFIMEGSPWWENRRSIDGLGTEIGTGPENSRILIDALGDQNCIWKTLKELKEDTGIDYFIPSREEASLIQRTVRENPNNFLSGFNYSLWTSSESTTSDSSASYFNPSGTAAYNTSKTYSYQFIVAQRI